MENTKYGKLDQNGILTYAPTMFMEDGKVVIPRSDDDNEYLTRGWMKVIDDRPSSEDGKQVEFDRWVEDTEAGTISATYTVTESNVEPTTRHVKYSKLKITLFLMDAGLWDDVKEFLQEVGYYDLFVMAQYFLDMDEYFQRGISAFRKHAVEDLGQEDDTVDQMVKDMLEKSQDGFEEA